MTDTPTRPQSEPSIDAESDATADSLDAESDATADSLDAETDTTADRSDGETDASPPTTGSSAVPGFDPASNRIQRYLAWGALFVCSLLAVFALVQFYGSVTDAIDLWVDAKYQPLMRAAFNLAVLLVSLIGVSLVVRELNAGTANR